MKSHAVLRILSIFLSIQYAQRYNIVYDIYKIVGQMKKRVNIFKIMNKM